MENSVLLLIKGISIGVILAIILSIAGKYLRKIFSATNELLDGNLPILLSATVILLSFSILMIMKIIR